MKVLLVEDEPRLNEALAYLLKQKGYAVDTALDGETGIELALTGLYDVIVLDRMLPKLDGLSIVKELRQLAIFTPVLFLTAKDAPHDRVEGLDAGADDYLIKPFSNEELLARLRALLRRKEKDFVGPTLSIAGVTFDPLRNELAYQSQQIRLTSKEALVFELLARNAGQVVTKERILEKVWGFNADSTLASVDLYIHYLRRKLPLPLIKTVRSVGYVIQEE